MAQRAKLTVSLKQGISLVPGRQKEKPPTVFVGQTLHNEDMPCTLSRAYDKIVEDINLETVPNDSSSY